MNPQNCLIPSEIAEVTSMSSVKKAKLSIINQIILGGLAGAFIAFASEGSNMAAFNLFQNPMTYGLGKALAGSIFGTGLMLVVLAGGELFTGNTMMVMGVLEKKITIQSMFRNWVFVYLGNFIGSLLIAYMIVNSGILSSGANGLGGITIKIASYKVGLSFTQAFFLGVMCNWLVCLAVWMANGAKDMVGKLFAIFFPIWLFITSGFEHCIANMYYIPAGILAKGNPAWAAASHVTADKLAHLNWSTFVMCNLIPVTLGNIVGGSLLVGGVYWFCYLKKSADVKDDMKLA